MLLSAEERVRCRNEIDVANERRANRQADARTRRAVADTRGAAWLDGIPEEKRAYYDAVAAARAAVRSGGAGGKAAGLSCNLGALFGGGGGAPTEKIKVPGLPCSIIPPQGVLTEEARISTP